MRALEAIALATVAVGVVGCAASLAQLWLVTRRRARDRAIIQAQRERHAEDRRRIAALEAELMISGVHRRAGRIALNRLRDERTALKAINLLLSEAIDDACAENARLVHQLTAIVRSPEREAAAGPLPPLAIVAGSERQK